MNLDLTDEQAALQDHLAGLLKRKCPPSRVRAAEPGGFDADLWRELREFGLPRFAITANGDKDNATLLSLALMAEQVGRFLAPAPFVETCIAARFCSRLALPEGLHSAAALVEAIFDGEQIATIAFEPLDRRANQILPSGACASVVLGLMNGSLVFVPRENATVRSFEDVHGSVPMARWEMQLGGAITVAPIVAGDLERAVAEWKVLTASALVGLGKRAVELGAEYAAQRRAFGTIIGKFQGVAHPLANAITDLDGAELLARRAAWEIECGSPGEGAVLAAMAFAFCAESAMKAARVATHVFGGYGAAREQDIQLYFQRAKAWPLVFGDPRREYETVSALRERAAAR